MDAGSQLCRLGSGFERDAGTAGPDSAIRAGAAVQRPRKRDSRSVHQHTDPRVDTVYFLNFGSSVADSCGMVVPLCPERLNSYAQIPNHAQ